MRSLLATVAFACALLTSAQDAVIRLAAPKFAGQVAVLYRYDDLFTQRTVRVASALIDEAGRCELKAPVKGTDRLRIRIGDAQGDLYARPGVRYEVAFAPPPPGTARTIGGTTRTELVFHDLDPLDVNALTSDLNNRIDAFIAEDLATDQAAGMQALPVTRKASADSTRRPSTLFVMPTWSKARVDSFETRVRRFYRDVDDPWFAHYLTYSFAGLRHGPRVNEAELHKAYLEGKPVLYDDPEYVRFVRGFHADQLMLAQSLHRAAYDRAFAAADADSLKAVLGRSEFLKDERLREAVAIDLLHQQFNTALVRRPAAIAMLKQMADQSPYAEHRTMAANAVWDLTAMRAGERVPTARLEDLRGRETALDSLLNGPVCLVVTASWCTYCDQELQGLEELHRAYGDAVHVIAIALDQDAEALRRYVKQRPGMGWTWLRATAEQELRDDWRIVSIPSFYLLNDGVIARSPAPPPSRGLGAILHQAKAARSQEGRLKVWDD